MNNEQSPPLSSFGGWGALLPLWGAEGFSALKKIENSKNNLQVKNIVLYLQQFFVLL
jgi:hypothetical protein